MGFNLAPQAGATEHGWAAAVVLTVYKNWIAQRRGVVHQMTVRIEESSAAIDAKQCVNTNVIKHVDQVVSHRPSKAGGCLGSFPGLLDGGALAKLFARLIQGAAGLLQPWGDAA
ncbi:hypothetical protein D3C76_1092650 [compost metagenome]